MLVVVVVAVDVVVVVVVVGWLTSRFTTILLMEEILHQLIW